MLAPVEPDLFANKRKDEETNVFQLRLDRSAGDVPGTSPRDEGTSVWKAVGKYALGALVGASLVTIVGMT